MDYIEHKGVVIAKSIGKNNKESLTISTIVESACASCHLKGACSSGDIAKKEVTVAAPKNRSFEVGDEVTLIFSEKSAIFLVFITYIKPIITVIALLFILTELNFSEISCALYSLIYLVLYYMGLHLFMKSYNKKIEIKIKA